MFTAPPIEYLHRNDKSIISQREIAIDTEDYLSALRACLRHLVGLVIPDQAADILQLPLGRVLLRLQGSL